MCFIIFCEVVYFVFYGVVIFGYDFFFIRQRCSKYIYGIEVFEIFDLSKYDENYKYEKNGEFCLIKFLVNFQMLMKW